MPAPLAISADQARRFLVSRHLLDPPRSLPAESESVLRVIERLGSVQFDPVEVPGARSHDLTFHARIDNYRREWADRWLYGLPDDPRDRRLIELYNKSLNILPIAELPYYALAWQRYDVRYENGILRDESSVADAILAGIRRDGPLSSTAFKEHNHAVDWWWAPTSAARAVLEALFVTGRVGISRRDGNRRYFDLIERLVPETLLGKRAVENDAARHRLLSRYRGVGLLGAQMAGEVAMGTGKAPERARILAGLVDDGTLFPVQVEGLRQPRYVLAEEEPILEEAARQPRRAPSGTFVAPLDPLMWDRRLVRDLFGFEYLWEIYVPAAKRRHGYYVLPILFGDQLVGRIEPRYERREKALRVLGIWFEDGFQPMAEPGFLEALGDAVGAYTTFVGAKSVTWPRTRPGRDIAGALRRLRAA
jgi:uncharacterized protein YcaQ